MPSVSIGLGPCSAIVRVHERSRGDRYGPSYYLATAAADKGEPIATVRYGISYPLFGNRLRTRVIWSTPLPEDNAETWLARVRSSGARLIAIGPIAQANKVQHEISWLRDPANRCSHVTGVNPALHAVVYRVAD